VATAGAQLATTNAEVGKIVGYVLAGVGGCVSFAALAGACAKSIDRCCLEHQVRKAEQRDAAARRPEQGYELAEQMSADPGSTAAYGLALFIF
jgi:hypothetical protein